jgi:ribosomal protein S18 acetylase RimI-like enzyme
MALTAPTTEMLRRLDRYFDAVPRSVARTEEVGPFTLFINEGIGWRFYARPRPGEAVFEPSDVQRVLERQQAMAQPRQLEWTEDVSPGVGRAAMACGLAVSSRPLMLLERGDLEPLTPPAGCEIRFAEPGDDLATMLAVAMVGFGSPGTGIGAPGTDEVADASDSIEPATLAFTRGRIAARSSRLAVAIVDGRPVATGSHQPVDGVTEITGVACLPAFRRRGLGAAVTAALAADASAGGVHTICLSAGDTLIARVYERVGFRGIGTVGEATISR